MKRCLLARFWILVAWVILPARLDASETVWFGGTRRAMPVSLAEPKESGLRSVWALTNNGETTWDFGLGTDVSVCQFISEATYQCIGARFGVASRFEFGSKSFDLWAADFRGGGVWGMRYGKMACEIFLFHESSHLGDEILERGERTRRDVSINGVRATVSRHWSDWLRTYGGMSGLPIAEPDELQSLGFHVGAELTSLPPWKRGYLAVSAECWEWRSWNPDVTAQLGLFIGPRETDKLLSTARVYFEFHSGRVTLGQYFDETETSFALGLGLHW